jgi:hypothetical protein
MKRNGTKFKQEQNVIPQKYFIFDLRVLLKFLAKIVTNFGHFA